VLSEADNWYVPGRLTAEMNRLLDTTDAPFGRVVQPLEPYRRPIDARILWLPLPDGWDRPGASALPPDTGEPMEVPRALFEHRAVLYTREHRPFSEVHEIYQRGILAFPPRDGPRCTCPAAAAAVASSRGTSSSPASPR
jgi:hypothetical protein